MRKLCARLAGGRWTSVVESFNSFRLGYLSKRHAYPKQRKARMASAWLSWNENHSCSLFQDWRQSTMKENNILWFFQREIFRLFQHSIFYLNIATYLLFIFLYFIEKWLFRSACLTVIPSILPFILHFHHVQHFSYFQLLSVLLACASLSCCTCVLLHGSNTQQLLLYNIRFHGYNIRFHGLSLKLKH